MKKSIGVRCNQTNTASYPWHLANFFSKWESTATQLLACALILWPKFTISKLSTDMFRLWCSRCLIFDISLFDMESAAASFRQPHPQQSPPNHLITSSLALANIIIIQSFTHAGLKPKFSTHHRKEYYLTCSFILFSFFLQSVKLHKKAMLSQGNRAMPL